MVKDKPTTLVENTASGATLVRFNSLKDLFWYDIIKNNVSGISIKSYNSTLEYERNLSRYFKERSILTARKQEIIKKAMKSLKTDKDFIELVYKAKSIKRKQVLNKFGGNLSMPHYASNSEKIFNKGVLGAKKATLDIAFQVGTFSGRDYENSFISIIKTILMCQAMNISVNIDMFDSDTSAIQGGAYVICNVLNSREKLNLKNILTCSHIEFFNCSLFNGYSASGKQRHIGTFLPERTIIKDLSDRYDIIGGNTIREVGENKEQREMISRILKIGLNGIRT